MVGELLRGLESRFSWLATWTGGRLDIELPALFMSLTVHGLLLVGLAFAGYQAHRGIAAAGIPIGDGGQPSDVGLDVSGPGSVGGALGPDAGGRLVAPTLAPTITSAPSTAGGVPVSAVKDSNHALAPELARLDVKQATELVLPTANMLGRTVSIKGNGDEMVGGVEGAVDRIAVEIVRHLEQGPTLVVWAFDASGSLQAERERLSKHIETVYTHIKQLDETNLAADSGLLTMVVSFGRDRKAMLPKPTAERSEILEAISNIVQDESGVETTFTTVAEIVNRWGKYHDSAAAMPTARWSSWSPTRWATMRAGSRIPSPWPRRQGARLRARLAGHLRPDRELRDLYRPEDQARLLRRPGTPGTQERMLEQIRLPFWYRGPQFEILESGFGPFALSRLARATGGIYFITRFDTHRMGFDPARMLEYQPDWERREVYERQIDEIPLAPGGHQRRADHPAEAARHARPVLPARGRPRVQGGDGQQSGHRRADRLHGQRGDRPHHRRRQAPRPRDLPPMAGPLRPDPRALLAMKVRCYEYNWACARMKKDPPKFSSPKSNAWRLVPDQAIQYSEKAATAAPRPRCCCDASSRSIRRPPGHCSPSAS